ncbi:hypothetical protein P4H42_05675 [Paenibacillus macerans]|nr:hypothetical protein [Paenibacillus macerans]MEC0329112.1 hypothetical protein [Paenibacillus macerans]MED4954253.1 hypothetical protein [Paenibacillus macerans]
MGTNGVLNLGRIFIDPKYQNQGIGMKGIGVIYILKSRYRHIRVN